MNEEIDHTEPVEEEEVIETTPEETTEDSVEDFSEKLDKAETEEEAIAAFKGEEPEEEEEPTEEEELDTEPEPTFDRFNLKDGEIELSLNLDDEKERKQAIMLAQQGLNYAGKTTELAKYKSFVNYAEENGITLEDIQMMKDIKAGDKSAIAKVSKSADIDLYDIDSDMADDYVQEPIQLQQEADPRLDTIANEILSNEEYRTTFQKWFPTIPEDVQSEIMSNPQVLDGVREDIEAGVFDSAMNQAYKYQKINGMDFGSAYTRAKQEFIAINQPEQTPPVTRGDIRRASAPRSGGGTPPSNRGGYAQGAITDMNDADFLQNYNDIVASVQANR